MNLVWIILCIIALLIILVIYFYNSLVSLKNRTDEAWSDIDVQLKRRYDLIPNLVKTVKGYAKHETEVFEKVTKARTEAIAATGVKGQQEAEDALTKTLKSVFAVAENYPTLRASENFQKLQDELTDTENKIEAARRFYNGNVRDLNIRLEAFPSSVIGSLFNFKKKELFKIAQVTEREPVKVDL